MTAPKYTVTAPRLVTSPELAALKQALRDFEPICKHDYRFDADDHQVRLEVVHMCHQCTIRDICRAAGASVKSWGIWGGIDRSDHHPITCKQGHPLVPGNLIAERDYQLCADCKHIRDKRSRDAAKERANQ